MFGKRRRAVLRHGALWATAFIALALFVVVVAGVWQFWKLQSGLERQAMLVQIVMTQRDALLQLVNEETGVRGYVATGDKRFLQIYYTALPLGESDDRSIAADLGILPGVEPAVVRFRLRADSVRRYFVREIELMGSHRDADARSSLASGRILFDRVRSAEAVAESEANTELRSQRLRTAVLARMGLFVGLLVCATLIFCAVAFAVLLRRARAYRLTASRDPLTGAWNRRGATSAIETLIAESPSEPFGLVFIDLDGFKKINDNYGHATGDAILQGVALRLNGEVRDEDNVCRLGGDEFVCVIAPPTGMDQLLTIAARLQKAVERPYSYQDEHYWVGCSVGVSLYPRHGRTVEVLLARADDAMYDAKAAGGGVRQPV